MLFKTSLSLWLVVFTMIVTLSIQKWLGNEASLSTWGVGYSCVLFALMTIYILTGDTGKCGVSFFGMCFPTIHFSIPATKLSIPFNAYPFIQLLLMKVLIPNSSFTGHLSGILLG